MPASTFSYAQAAKGLGSSNASPRAAPPASSEEIATAKTPLETQSQDTSTSESKMKEQSQAPQNSAEAHLHDGHSTNSEQAPDKGTHREPTGSVSPPSIDLIQSSMSTLPHEDDMSSVPAASSESTWENVSLASIPVDKTQDPADKASKKENKDGAWVQVSKPQVEAPIPAVNIWKQRMEQSVKTAPVLPKKVANANGIHPVPATTTRPIITNGSNDRKTEPTRQFRGKDIKRDMRPEHDQSKSRRDAPRAAESSHKAQPPSLQDEASWPTPEIAQDEERKKSVDKDEKQEAAKAPVKKAEWKKVELQHNVIWQTPLPNTHSRRGGRATARGGRDASSNRLSPTNTRATRSPTSQTTTDVTSVVPAAKIENTAAGDTSPLSKQPIYNDNSAKPTASAKKGNTSVDSYRSDDIAADVTGADARATVQHSLSAQGHSSKKAGLGIDVGGNPGEASQERASNGAHRRNSVGRLNAKTSEADEEQHTLHGDSGAARHAPKSGHAANGGGRRGSLRGRGGFSNYHSHHSPSVGWSASPSPHYTKSPSAVQDSYWNGNQNQRGFRTPRGHSSASFSNGYSSSGMLSPINTYPARASYDQQMQTMSAMPYNPMMDQYSLIGMVSMQLEYYFSLENLLRDVYLRKHMDSQGFVVLDVIAGFNRLKNLTQDLEVLKTVCQQSGNIEYRLGVDGKSRIRKLEGWDKWVLEKSQRDPGAQHDGVDAVNLMSGPYSAMHDSSFYNTARHASLSQPLGSPQYAPYLNGQAYPLQYFSPQPMDTAQRFQASPPMFNQPFANSRPFDHHRSISGSSNYANLNGVGSSQHQQVDVIPDSQVENLVIMTREPGQNEGLDLNQSTENAHQLQSTSDSTRHHAVGAAVSNESPISSPVYHDEVRNQSIEPQSTTPDSARASVDLSVEEGSEQAIRTRAVINQPQASKARRVRPERYLDVRSNALKQRQLRASRSFYPYDMVVLYQFWQHYLVSNFNTKMFEEFAQLAEEDLQEYDNIVGMQNLVAFFMGALAHCGPIPQTVISHFVRLAELGINQPEKYQMALHALKASMREATPTQASKFVTVLNHASVELQHALT